MKYFSDNIQLLNFTGDSHVENHLNYLFRTDKKQKWTNKDTKYNAFSTPTKESFDLYGFSENLEERNLVKDIFKSKMLPSNYKNLYMTRIECTNPDIYYWNKEMVNEMKELVSDIMETQEDYIVLLVVIHDDQPENYTHFHMLLLGKEE
ncbi:MAG: hypothetical protein HFH60_03630 [Lachnospiraceae bacterium]|jgi:hypothetical protein|nr:hypothetical protein [Lachnospiraceae bacterium]